MQDEHAPNTIGQRLRRFLAYSGMSIRDLEKKTGIKYRTLQDYLADESKPGADHLVKLGDSGVELQWLLTGRAALPFGFRSSETDKGASLLAADRVLMEKLFEKAADMADSFAQRHHEKTKGYLTFRQFMLIVGYYFDLVVSVAVKMLKNIEDLRKVGQPVDAISNILFETVGDKFDQKLIDLLSPGGTDTPRSRRKR